MNRKNYAVANIVTAWESIEIRWFYRWKKSKKALKNKKVKKIKKILKIRKKMLDKYCEIDYYIQAL